MSSPNTYDRETEVKNFDSSKLGVKGLLDSGIKTVPRIFHQPPENLPCKNFRKNMQNVPLIDMSQDRSKVVEQVRNISSTFGFFQVVNHGVDVKLIERVVNDLKKFYEMENEYKMRFYTREAGKGAAYFTNIDLFHSKAATWKDSLQVILSPVEPDWEAVPEMFRQALKDWDKALFSLGDELMSILCEGLGIKSEKLKELTCLEARRIVSHYYPHCPQPDLTIGANRHTDPVVLSMLVQNEVGRLLQAKYGEDWVAVEAIPGAIVVNIGDLLQIMSNGEYKSAEHRVLANPQEVARVSVVLFFTPSMVEKHAPFPELISAEKPAVYKEVTYSDYMRRFFANELGEKTIDFYRIDE